MLLTQSLPRWHSVHPNCPQQIPRCPPKLSIVSTLSNVHPNCLLIPPCPSKLYTYSTLSTHTVHQFQTVRTLCSIRQEAHVRGVGGGGGGVRCADKCEKWEIGGIGWDESPRDDISSHILGYNNANHSSLPPEKTTFYSICLDWICLVGYVYGIYITGCVY